MNESEKALIYVELREFYDAEEARLWMESPQPLLEGRRACDCSFDEVMVVIDQLKSGVFV